MKNIKVIDEKITDEELKIIKQNRAQKLNKELEQKRIKDFEFNRNKLEKLYNDEYDRIFPQIEQHIKQAAIELDKAVKLSEEHGITFKSNIVDMEYVSRRYIPKSKKEKFPELCSQGRDTFYFDSGWEYWNTSSFSC